MDEKPRISFDGVPVESSATFALEQVERARREDDLARYGEALRLIAMQFCNHAIPNHPPYDPSMQFCATCEARKALGWPPI